MNPDAGRDSFTRSQRRRLLAELHKTRVVEFIPALAPLPRRKRAQILQSARATTPKGLAGQLLGFIVGAAGGLYLAFGATIIVVAVVGSLSEDAAALIALILFLSLPIAGGAWTAIQIRRAGVRTAIERYISSSACPRCAYDLRGAPSKHNVQTCPECGQVKILVGFSAPARSSEPLTP
jgi:hypothetical protein